MLKILFHLLVMTYPIPLFPFSDPGGDLYANINGMPGEKS
jgi:hypothetical protein